MVIGRRIRSTRVEVAPPMAMATPLPELPALLLLRRSPPPLTLVARDGAAFPREPLLSRIRGRRHLRCEEPAQVNPT